MRTVIAITLLVIVSTARDDQTRDCLRQGDCQDVKVEQTVKGDSSELPYNFI
jgi:hypothetical protein